MVKIQVLEALNKIKNLKIKNNFKNRKLLIRNKLIQLIENSTSHGLPNIMKTNRISIKILWIIFLLIAIGACSYMIAKTISEYLQYEVVAYSEVITELSSEFPAITLCDTNPLTTKTAEQYVEELLNNDNFTDVDLDARRYIDILSVYAYQANLNAFSFENADFQKSLGLNLTEVFLNCHYNDIECSLDEFEWKYDRYLGNCYTFNSGSVKTLYKTSITGSDNGFRLELLLKSSENKYSTKYSEGLIVFVHNSTIDSQFSPSIKIKSSESTDIMLSRTFVSKQPYPYSDCRDLDNLNSELYNYIIKSKKTYIQTDCFDLYYQKKVIEVCNCYNNEYPKLKNVSVCLKEKETRCQIDVYDMYRREINDECKSLCPLECNSIIYDFTISSSSYPNQFLYDVFSEKGYIFNITYEEFRSRAIELNVYYNSLTYAKLSESPKTSIVDLFSNIGGTLGLYVGVSLLSLVELFEIFAEFVFICFF
jgi:hypothetical protein